MNRRQFLGTVTASMAALTGCTTNQTESGTTPPRQSLGQTDDGPGTSPQTPGSGPDAVGLETIVSGLQAPLDVAVLPDGQHRYIAEKRGTIRVLDDTGLRSDPLLDLRSSVVTGYEQGLLGLALHPDFAQNRRFFVRYSAPRREGTPSGYSHTFVLSEFVASDDGLAVDPATERPILELPQPQSNHNAGSLAFGPDGYLYVGTGDGGAGGDQGTGHVEDWYSAVGGGNGQDVTANLLGSILRIDVDGRSDGRAYAIPSDNPLVDRTGRDEHYAWGFRNPWRLAFDGDDLYAGDVGQNRYEEVDIVKKGGNYGWNVKEGTHCYQTNECPDSTPDKIRGGEPLLDPVIEYPHGDASVSGISVITGNVYRGDAVPSLQGRFVFGDYRAQGRLFTAVPDGDGLWQTAVLPIADGDASKLSGLFSFHRHRGELFVLANGENGGGLHRIVSAET